MQLDAEDDEQPFFKPSVVQTEPLIPSQKKDAEQAEPRTDQPGEETQPAGIITAEQEE
jgi:hypothetical protein